MRILFVTPYVPSSVRIRPLAFIRELARRGHEITLVCLIQPSWEANYLAEVTPYCKAVYPVFPNRFEPYLQTFASLPSGMPLSVAFCRSQSLEQLLEFLNRREEFDLIHTEFLRAVPATLRLEGRPKVFDAVDSLALAYRRSMSASHVTPRQRLVALVEWLKIRKYEPSIINHYQHLLVSSPIDQQMLSQVNQGVTVVPNGVDLDYFQPWEGEREPATIMFLGKMSYYVNVASVLWFYRKVFPLIRSQRPDARLKIVGRSPAKSIAALARDPAVEVTGTVPDVRPHLAGATLSICPMVSGSGIQNKMLEAMAVGTPCVSTEMACQALQAVPGQDVLVSGSAQQFADAVLTLLDQPDLRRQIGQNGRRYVERYHDWKGIGDCLNDVYLAMMRA